MELLDELLRIQVLIDDALVEERLRVVDQNGLVLSRIILSVLVLNHLHYLLLLGHHFLLNQHVVASFGLCPCISAFDVLTPSFLVDGGVVVLLVSLFNRRLGFVLVNIFLGFISLAFCLSLRNVDNCALFEILSFLIQNSCGDSARLDAGSEACSLLFARDCISNRELLFQRRDLFDFLLFIFAFLKLLHFQFAD